MRIVIDLQGAQSPYSSDRGVGRYTIGIVKSFLKIAQYKHDVYLVLNGAFQEKVDDLRFEFSEFIPLQNIKCWQQYLTQVAGISGEVWSRNVSELIREWYINQLRPDVIWSTNLQEGWLDDAVSSVKKINCGAIYCSTLHDVIPLLFPEKYLATNIKFWYQEKIDYIKDSDIVLTVSNYSKGKIVELLGIDSSKVHIAGNFINTGIFNPDGSREYTSANTNISNLGSFILYVGGADEHKNVLRLISAYSFLNESLRNQYNLVLVGKELKDNDSYFISYASIRGIHQDKIIFTGFVIDEDLAAMYRNCSLFVFPSYSEGFGIPPLEAMACGCPVIASSASSIPEVVGLHDALFNPFDEKEITDKITRGLTDQKFRKQLLMNAIERVSKFSWEQSARLVLDVFEETYNKKKKDCLAPDAEEIMPYNYSNLIEKISAISDKNTDELFTVAQTICDNTIPGVGTIPNFYIDLSCMVHFDHATGIQRVVRAITDQLLKSEELVHKYSVVSIFSYAGHERFYRAVPKNGKFNIPYQEELKEYIVDFKDGDIILFLDLHPGSAISKRGEIVRLRNRGVKTYFVVYDLLPISFPDYFVKELSLEFREWLCTVALADGAICISQDVANNFKSWIEESKVEYNRLSKITYFHLGADLQSSVPSKGLPKDASALLTLCEEKYSFLMVGTLEPRKGHSFVLDAFEKAWINDEQIILIIVGKIGWHNEMTIERIRNHPELNKRLFWLEGISDEYLEEIYSISTCLIAASQGEGFGLPLIEAAQKKKPIIARDISVFREVAGDNAYYFENSNNSQVLLNAIQNWLVMYEKGTHPKSDEMLWLTWEESARMLLERIEVFDIKK